MESTRIGRYLLEDFLGTGTYAIVYRASDTILNRTVALKVLKPVWVTDDEIYARFVREAQAAANLIHPHIAWVYDFGEADGRHYLASRFIDGESLDKILAARGSLPWNEAMAVLADIGSCLDFAHSKGIIHRDVKPQNIMVSLEEGAVLTDFGLTKALGDQSRLTKAGAIVGTPQYIPPEIWNGEPAGPSADQYALACIFFEMVTGKILYEGPVIETILRSQLRSGAPVTTLPGEFPPGAVAVLGRALARRPEDRYPNLAALVAALHQLTADLLPEVQTAAHPESLPPPIIPPFQPEEEYPEDLDSTQAQPAADVDRPSKPGTATLSSLPWRERVTRALNRLNPSAARRESPAARLVFQFDQTANTGETEDVIPLERQRYLIGRSATSDIVIDNPDISRQHAGLFFSPQGWKLKDMRSTNGTFCNGERVTGEISLSSGDIVRLGSTVRFVFYSGEADKPG